MAAAMLRNIWRTIQPSRLLGPIVDKELRVTSRRRRFYVLRFAYLAMMLMFVALVWYSATRSYSAGYSSAMMSRAGQQIASVIVGFQFVAVQLIAVVLMSTAISEEIYRRTLGVLMTTPITSFQIVMGKLLSKLLQMAQLVALSLPLLALVRVFGGVPWESVIGGLCLTLASAVFAGAVSLYFSIYNRRAYVAIIKAVLALATLFALLPVLVAFYLHDSGRAAMYPAMDFLIHVDPYVGIYALIADMMTSGMAPFTISWPLMCAVQLGAAALVLGICVVTVRKVALRQATGEAGEFISRRRRRREAKTIPAMPAMPPPVPGMPPLPTIAQAMPPAMEESDDGPIREVTGSPIVWKEMQGPLVRNRLRSYLGIAGLLAVLGLSYLLCVKEDALNDNDTHTVYAIIFVILGTLITAVLTATGITSEKESRAWPLLLGTTLSDGHILLGKALGAMRRCIPVWCLLALHMVLFTLLGYIHPVAILQMLLVVAGVVVFFTGTGLLMSTLVKRTTTAVVLNVGLGLVIWALVPLILGILYDKNISKDLADAYVSGNPVVQTVVVIQATAGRDRASKVTAWARPNSLQYDWPYQLLNASASHATITLLACLAIYLAGGILAGLLAKRRLRKGIF